MKTISAALATHLTTDMTTMVYCAKITRQDGVVVGFTEHDHDLTIDCDGLGDVVYAAATAINAMAIDTKTGLGIDNLTVESVLDSTAISEEDLRAGKYQDAELKVFQVNWQDLSMGVLKLRRGIFGQMSLHRQTYIAEVNGLTQAFSRQIGELYSADCRAHLGDVRCQVVLTPAIWQATHTYEATDPYAMGDLVMATASAVPLVQWRCTVAGTSGGSEPAWDATLGNTTTDGGVTWTAEAAHTVPATVDAATNEHVFTLAEDFSAFVPVPGGGSPWFLNGVGTWLTGDNAGIASEIKAFTPGPPSIVTLFTPAFGTITPGDTLTLTVGCDWLRTTCRDKFHNLVNMRAEPFIPGLDRTLAYPDATKG